MIGAVCRDVEQNVLIMAIIWTTAARYMVFLNPSLSIAGSAAKQPVIFPIHGSEFINALRVAGRICFPFLATPNRCTNDGRACSEPNEPVSLHSRVNKSVCTLRYSTMKRYIHAKQNSTLQEDKHAEDQRECRLFSDCGAHGLCWLLHRPGGLRCRHVVIWSWTTRRVRSDNADCTCGA